MKPRTILKEWIKAKHYGQFVKKTNEPYTNHLNKVADSVKKLAPCSYEIGLCHDLLEKTDATVQELKRALISFGYAVTDADFICNGVMELTDRFTKKAFPGLSKVERKVKEAARLSTITPMAQSVKYADLLYNVDWVLKFQPHKAAEYLHRKKALLFTMDKGNTKLKKQLLKMIEDALEQFCD